MSGLCDIVPMQCYDQFGASGLGLQRAITTVASDSTVLVCESSSGKQSWKRGTSPWSGTKL